MAALLAFTALITPSSAAVVTVYWTGVVNQFTFFGGASPSGVADGVPISGSLVFDTTLYDSRIFLSGSHGSANRFRYINSSTVRFNVGETEWEILGTDIDLGTSSSVPSQTFGVTSDSDRNTPVAFPGYVGEFEAGFALVAENTPFPIFDSSEIETANFDFERPTSGSGSLTTRRLDANDDIVEGYYLAFTITQSSSSPIPEPSVTMLIAVTFCAIIARRVRLVSTASFS